MSTAADRLVEAGITCRPKKSTREPPSSIARSRRSSPSRPRPPGLRRRPHQALTAPTRALLEHLDAAPLSPEWLGCNHAMHLVLLPPTADPRDKATEACETPARDGATSLGPAR